MEAQLREQLETQLQKAGLLRVRQSFSALGNSRWLSLPVHQSNTSFSSSVPPCSFCKFHILAVNSKALISNSHSFYTKNSALLLLCSRPKQLLPVRTLVPGCQSFPLLPAFPLLLCYFNIFPLIVFVPKYSSTFEMAAYILYLDAQIVSNLLLLQTVPCYILRLIKDIHIAI